MTPEHDQQENSLWLIPLAILAFVLAVVVDYFEVNDLRDEER